MIPIVEQAASKGEPPPIGRTVGDLRQLGYLIHDSVKDWLVFMPDVGVSVVDTRWVSKRTGFLWDVPRTVQGLAAIGVRVGMSFTELDTIGWPLHPLAPRYQHVAGIRENTGVNGASPLIHGVYETAITIDAVRSEITRLSNLSGVELELARQSVQQSMLGEVTSVLPTARLTHAYKQMAHAVFCGLKDEFVFVRTTHEKLCSLFRDFGVTEVLERTAGGWR